MTKHDICGGKQTQLLRASCIYLDIVYIGKKQHNRGTGLFMRIPLISVKSTIPLFRHGKSGKKLLFTKSC